MKMRRFPLMMLTVVAALSALTTALVYEHRQVIELSESLAAVQMSLDQLAATQTLTASSTAANSADISALASKEPPVIKTQSELLEEAVAKVTPAVVSIIGYVNVTRYMLSSGARIAATTQQEVSRGTGFFVRANGYIITNRHVVEEDIATYEVVLSDGKRKEATVVWKSPAEETEKDLAVLKIEGTGYPRVTLGNSDTLRLAQTVFAVGNALGRFNNSVSVGVISGLGRDIVASGESLKGVIQTDAAINYGNSGGPLVNLAGEAVGVSVAVARGSQSIGFALPINEVKTALSNLGI